MSTDEATVLNTMQILTKWNPLDDRSVEIDDLDDYRTEAQDILFHVRVGLLGESPVEIVQNVLNSAFDLSLSLDECREPAEKITAFLSMQK